MIKLRIRIDRVENGYLVIIKKSFFNTKKFISKDKDEIVKVVNTALDEYLE